MNISLETIENIEYEVSEVYESILRRINVLPNNNDLRTFLVRQQDRLGTVLDYIEELQVNNAD